MNKKSLLGAFAAVIVSVMLMVDVPVNANDPLMKGSAGANPNWPVQTLKEMRYKHLAFTTTEVVTTEVVSRLKKDWAADIQTYDQGHAHMMMFADALSDGILKQHPKKFRK